MCTIGAILLSCDEYLLFKNKDFGQTDFEERVAYSPSLFEALGVESFDKTDDSPVVFSGISIGANEHGLLCCDAHVDFKPDGGKNYDLLVEIALTKGRDVPTALVALEDYLSQTPTWAGNLVLTDGTETACVEARGTEMCVQRSDRFVSKCNHQDLFETGNAPASESSQHRFQSSQQQLNSVENLNDVFALLKSHGSGNTGICNHLEGRRTVYSYVLHVKRGDTVLYVAKGQPCTLSAYQKFALPFSEAWTDTDADLLFATYPR